MWEEMWGGYLQLPLTILPTNLAALLSAWVRDREHFIIIYEVRDVCWKLVCTAQYYLAIASFISLRVQKPGNMFQLMDG